LAFVRLSAGGQIRGAPSWTNSPHRFPGGGSLPAGGADWDSPAGRRQPGRKPGTLVSIFTLVLRSRRAGVEQTERGTRGWIQANTSTGRSLDRLHCLFWPPSADPRSL